MVIYIEIIVFCCLVFRLLYKLFKKNTKGSLLTLLLLFLLVSSNVLFENNFQVSKIINSVNKKAITIETHGDLINFNTIANEKDNNYLTFPFTVPKIVDTSIKALPSKADYCEVHFLDVGRADSELIICNHEALLIDGGNVDDSSFLTSYLEKLGITELKYVISTHPHEDHVGGLAEAINFATVTNGVFSPFTEYGSNAFKNFKNSVNKQGFELVVPEEQDIYYLGIAKLTILSVLKNASTNNSSIVCRLDFFSNSFLFTGDAEYEAEEHLLSNGANLKADVLKVAHHGADTSTMSSFLDAVSPEIAVIEVGEDIWHELPNSKTLKLLQNANAKIYRTDLNGTVIIRSDGNNLTVLREK